MSSIQSILDRLSRSGSGSNTVTDWGLKCAHSFTKFTVTDNFLCEIQKLFGSGAVFASDTIWRVLEALESRVGDIEEVPVFMCSVGCGKGSTLSVFATHMQKHGFQKWSFCGVDRAADGGGGMTSKDTLRYVPDANFYEGDAVSYMSDKVQHSSDAIGSKVWLLEMSWPETAHTNGWGVPCIETFVVKAKENNSLPLLLYTGLHAYSEGDELKQYIRSLLSDKATQINTVPIRNMLEDPHVPDHWDKTFLIDLN